MKIVLPKEDPMRIVVQRVKSCVVRQGLDVVSSIYAGYMLLVCFKRGDVIETAQVVKKVIEVKLFDSWKKDVRELGLELMVLSQFTLYAGLKKKNPSFHDAEKHDVAKGNFDQLVNAFKAVYGDAVKCGLFGTKLDIDVALDGPCTIIMDF